MEKIYENRETLSYYAMDIPWDFQTYNSDTCMHECPGWGRNIDLNYVFRYRISSGPWIYTDETTAIEESSQTPPCCRFCGCNTYKENCISSIDQTPFNESTPFDCHVFPEEPNHCQACPQGKFSFGGASECQDKTPVALTKRIVNDEIYLGISMLLTIRALR